MAVDLKEIFAVHTAYNEDINPAIDRGATEKIVSCDRFVGWTLFDTGFSYNHLRKHGYTLYGPQNLENYLISMGFTRIDDINEVRGGDVMFVGVSDWFKSLPEDWKSNPDHTFICAGLSTDGRFFRYDGGSDKRLQSIQPLDEPLELPKKPFRFAYRAPEEIPNI